MFQDWSDIYGVSIAYSVLGEPKADWCSLLGARSPGWQVNFASLAAARSPPTYDQHGIGKKTVIVVG